MARPSTAREASRSRHVKLKLRGTGDFDGEFRGTGRLSFAFSDATRASLEVDYSRPDELVVGLGATTGVELSADDTLVLDGGLSWDRVARELEGEVEAELRIARGLGVVISQSLEPGPDTTRLEVTLSF